MTRDEIVKLAQESGFRVGHITLTSGDPIAFIAPLSATSCIVELERFAALVAAAEREACAKVCDIWVDFPGAQSGASKCAAAIRSRIEPPRVGD